MQVIDFSSTNDRFELPLAGQTARFLWRRNGEEAQLTVRLAYAAAYGMGEKFNALNQKGRVAVNQVEEKFCCQGGKTYCPAPFFFTDSGLGLYVATDRRTVFDFSGGEIVITLPAGAPVYVGAGSPRQLVGEYMRLFGPAKLPPKWAFGPWISANHWSTQSQVEEQIGRLAEHGYPATVLVVEAWSDEATFYAWNGARYAAVPGGGALRCEDMDFSQSRQWPDPKAMIRRLHGAGLHLVLWQIPVYKKQGPDQAPCPQNELDRADAAARGLCVKNADGTPYTIPEGNWFAGSMIPDFTNPDTVKSWFGKRQYLLDMGVDGFKTDGGEFIYRPDLTFADGATGREGKNRYARDYTAAYSRFLGGQRVLFSRAGWAGQHTVPCHWGGDQQSTNEELAHALTAGLSAAMSGIPFWGFDIAGFAGPLPTPDLYRRATQLACFCPIMQWHSEPDGGQFKELMPGAEGNNERSPWNLAAAWGEPDLVDELRFWHRLRMNLIPYLYSTALDCAVQNQPMLRPLAYLWPQRPEAVAHWDEFMLGESLLVAPLLGENQTRRPVWLPEGDWYELFSGGRFAGLQTILAGSAERLPVFVKGGQGVALNLDESLSLGSPVGNRVEGYDHLCFLLAGPEGSCHFADETGGALTLRWQDGRVTAEGSAGTPYTFKILG